MSERASQLRSDIEQLRRREADLLDRTATAGVGRIDLADELASVRANLRLLTDALAEADSLSLTGDGEQRP